MSKVVSKYRRGSVEMPRKARAYRRGHAVLGALIGAAIPLAFGISEHGLLLGRTIETASIFLGLALFCALIGAGVATKNFGRFSSNQLVDEGKSVWKRKDGQDRVRHEGIYAYRRDETDLSV